MTTAIKTNKLKPSTNKQSRSRNGLSHSAKTLSIQAKLTISKPNYKYGQEADKVADKVMSMPSSQMGLRHVNTPEPTNVQRKCAACEAEDKQVQKEPLAAGITRWVQRQEEEKEEVARKLIQRQEEEKEEINSMLIQKQEEEKDELKPKLQFQPEVEEDVKPKLQLQPVVEEEVKPKLQLQDEEDKEIAPKLIRKQEAEEDLPIGAIAESGKPPVQTKHFSLKSETNGASLESRLSNSKSGGSPLPDNTRSFMESRIGADFSKVKVHTGSNAVQMNKELNAQAFTHGNHVYFNTGKYSPTSSSGKHLLAHELTHTLQQGEQAVQQGNKAITVLNAKKEKELPYHIIVPVGDTKLGEIDQVQNMGTAIWDFYKDPVLGLSDKKNRLIRKLIVQMNGGVKNWKQIPKDRKFFMPPRSNVMESKEPKKIRNGDIARQYANEAERMAHAISGGSAMDPEIKSAVLKGLFHCLKHGFSKGCYEKGFNRAYNKEPNYKKK